MVGWKLILPVKLVLISKSEARNLVFLLYVPIDSFWYKNILGVGWEQTSFVFHLCR